MNASDIGIGGLAASLVLVAIGVAISLREHLRLEREMVVAVVRSLVQMAIVGVALKAVIDPGTPLVVSWLWVGGILLFAADTVRRRAPDVPGVFGIALLAHAASAAVGLAVAFGAGIFPLTGRTLVPVAGMLIGNAMKSSVTAGQRLVEGAAERRQEIEARLALGLPWQRAAAPVVRSALRIAITPQIENIRGLGIVFLPGAMTGLILAGVDPLKAILVQLALMYLMLGGIATTTTVTGLLAARRLFTADHRLRPLARSTRDE